MIFQGGSGPPVPPSGSAHDEIDGSEDLIHGLTLICIFIGFCGSESKLSLEIVMTVLSNRNTVSPVHMTDCCLSGVEMLFPKRYTFKPLIETDSSLCT